MRNKRDDGITEPKGDLGGLSDTKGQYETLNPRLVTNADKPRDQRPATDKILRD